MEAGKLRHRLTIENFSETTDPRSGQVLQDWSSTGEVWGEVRPLSGREAVNAQQIQSEVSHAITIRGGGDALSTQQRIKFGDRIFNILSILDTDERHIEIKMLATERKA